MVQAQMRVEHIGDATLYLGDCLEVLPTLGEVDAVVTDPPYGVPGIQNTRTGLLRGGRKNDYVGMTDSPEYVRECCVPAVSMCIKLAKRVVLTPGNKCFTSYPQPDSFGVIVQPASVGLQAWGRADCQPILFYGRSPHAGTGIPSQRCVYELTEAAETDAGHPCQKPINFWTHLLARTTSDEDIVLDPFMGSGTTGVACANLGRKFIGIEIEDKYFNIACERIDQAQRQQRLCP